MDRDIEALKASAMAQYVNTGCMIGFIAFAVVVIERHHIKYKSVFDKYCKHYGIDQYISADSYNAGLDQLTFDDKSMICRYTKTGQVILLEDEKVYHWTC